MSISPALANFFGVEIRNEESMRRENGAPGTDDYAATFTPGDDLYIPQATLGSAVDSWKQAPEDVRADWCEVSEADLPDVEADLLALSAARGEDYPLVDLLA